jgi:hypothetical protein
MAGYVEDAAHRDDAAATARIQLRTALGWFALLLGYWLLFGEVIDALTPFIAPLLWLLVLAIGALIALFGLWWAWRIRAHRRHALATALAFPAAFLLLGPAGDAALYLRFLAERPGHERTVAEIARNPAGWQSSREVKIDPGPPLRVAFVTWRSIPDPWGAIVHDPSGALSRIDRPYRLRLFDSSVMGCRHIAGAYYRCGFS